ncbi:MAG TPA: YlxM family DNA-binding protein [Clostridiaceae bacterium]|nr:YlxM family DNA-binding protein [Clostridiaceae bacterium]
MKNIYHISLLLDFYGQLLTKRQQEILDLHINNDYSLGEISEQLDISRQGVYDNVKRGKAALYEFEEKLGLIKKFSEQKEIAMKIVKLLSEIDKKNMSQDDIEKLNQVKNGIIDIVNGL